MRAAKPHELSERALPVMTATISEIELKRWMPFPFQEIDDPLAAAEPSKGALLQLDSGEYFVVYWGRDSGQLTVRIPEAVDAASFLSSFLNEVPVPRERITWTRDGVRLWRAGRVAAPLRLRGGRALVADDDFLTRDTVRRLLEQEGLTVDMVTNGEKAVGCLASTPYDLIVLDLVLPRLSGADVLEYLASTRPDMLQHVIILTGLETQDVGKLFPTVAEIFTKPLMPSRFLTAVRNLGSDDSLAEPQVS